MPFKTRAARFLQTIDYRYFLPLAGRLPLPLGNLCSLVRGGVLFGLDYDWRSLALGKRYIRSNTYQAMRTIMPDAGRLKWGVSTLARFVHHSREEWQACIFNSEVMEKIKAKSQIQGLEDLRSLSNRKQGVILISCHLDSFCMGMVLFGMNGIKINCLNTAMIEDPRIHHQVRGFFQRKYRAMEGRMGGKMEYHETNMDFFYRALKNGEVVALMGDIPGSKSSIRIPFLGRSFRMPLGAWHMAKKTGSLVGGYVCVYEGVGKYRVFTFAPRKIVPDDPERSLKPVYGFIESWIRKNPERWICSDLLTSYSV